jgi:hypothetical protein
VSTVFVVPCGLSVLDQLGSKLPRGGSHVRQFVDTVQMGAWLRGIDLDDDQAVAAAWESRAAQKAGPAGLSDIPPKRLSAETHSLATRVTAGSPRPGERILLLSSDTPAGVSAAFCVARRLAGGPDAHFSYTSTPGQRDGVFVMPDPPAPVGVIRVRELRPAAAEALSPAVAGIGKVLRAAWGTGSAVEVHLTGGFKATLLHTLVMTEVLHSMTPNRVSALYVFEDPADTRSEDPVEPVSIGLRAFPSEYINIMRRELTNVSAGSTTYGSSSFEGVGWKQDAAGVRSLTDFGYGYLAVLGRSSGMPGDDNS